MTLIRCNPRRDLWNIRGEMDGLFHRFFNREYEGGEFSGGEWVPRVDIAETIDQFQLKAELPGLNKDDVKISLQDNILTLNGEKKESREVKDSSYHLYERRYGRFTRAFRLSAPVDNGKIEASFINGILTVLLPKSEAAKPKAIEITAG
ncbi:Hsp20/alpha crystallin family protein [bacterium]|nr:Hsp20/alpha crystallin family protein [bacterium]